jgi:hypothetical protein
VCAPDDWWKYHPKHVEQFPDINKLCSCILLDIHVYWNILKMHGTINVKSPNNTSKWEMGFNSAFKGLRTIGCCWTVGELWRPRIYTCALDLTISTGTVLLRPSKFRDSTSDRLNSATVPHMTLQPNGAIYFAIRYSLIILSLNAA